MCNISTRQYFSLLKSFFLPKHPVEKPRLNLIILLARISYKYRQLRESIPNKLLGRIEEAAATLLRASERCTIWAMGIFKIRSRRSFMLAKEAHVGNWRGSDDISGRISGG